MAQSMSDVRLGCLSTYCTIFGCRLCGTPGLRGTTTIVIWQSTSLPTESHVLLTYLASTSPALQVSAFRLLSELTSFAALALFLRLS